MRNSVLAAAAAVAGMLQAGTASASAWTPPSHVRVVQQDTAGSTRVFTSIQSAIDDFARVGIVCAAAAPCVVKVMPGLYDLGVGSLVMKPFVDVVGSGRENTIITSAIPDSNDDCTQGTVKMVGNSSIREVGIVNTAPGGSHYVALLFTQGDASAERVTVVAGNESSPGTRIMAVCTGAASTRVELNDMNIDARAANGQPRGVEVMGGDLALRNSRIAVKAGDGGWCSAADDNTYGMPFHRLTISNTATDIECPNAYAVFGGSAAVDLSNSSWRIVVPPGSWVAPLYYGDAWTVVNVRFDIPGAAVEYWVNNPAAVKIAASQLPGTPSANLPDAILVGNFDSNFAPIQNTLSVVP